MEEQKEDSAQSYNEGMDDGYQKAYVELRTTLDSAEMIAVRYFFEGKTVEERNQRAEEIKLLISSVITKLSIRNPGGGRCPDGWSFCNGVCVPYDC